MVIFALPVLTCSHVRCVPAFAGQSHVSLAVPNKDGFGPAAAGSQNHHFSLRPDEF
jgi:hypothetical protein